MTIFDIRPAILSLWRLVVILTFVVFGCNSLARSGEAENTASVRPILAQQIASGAPPRDVARLLDAGADPLAPDRDGNTALHVAAMAHSPAYLKLLLSRGLDIDTRNRTSGRTPLVVAMLAERNRQFTMLLAAGASVTLTDRTGNTPLHIAAQINEPRLVLALLEAGASAPARNDQGRTFQPYLFMTPDRLLNAETLRSRRAVVAWLEQHGVALETGTP